MMSIYRIRLYTSIHAPYLHIVPLLLLCCCWKEIKLYTIITLLAMMPCRAFPTNKRLLSTFFSSSDAPLSSLLLSVYKYTWYRYIHVHDYQKNSWLTSWIFAGRKEKNKEEWIKREKEMPKYLLHITWQERTWNGIFRFPKLSIWLNFFSGFLHFSTRYSPIHTDYSMMA